MDQKMLNLQPEIINPQALIQKYQKALQRTREKVGAPYTEILASVQPIKTALGTSKIGEAALSYVGVQQDLCVTIANFIASLQSIVKDGSDSQTTHAAIMTQQSQFAADFSDYLKQETCSGQFTQTLTHFLKLLREQMQFETNDRGEKVTHYPAKNRRDYVKDEKFAKVYPNLAAADDQLNNLFAAFLTDCITLSHSPGQEANAESVPPPVQKNF